MATVTRTVNAWRTDGVVSNPQGTTYYNGSWSSADTGHSAISAGWFDGASRYFTMSYQIAGGAAGEVSGINFSLNVSSVSNTGTLTACLYDSEPAGMYLYPHSYLQNQIKSVSASSTNVAFSFSNLQIDATKPLYVVIFADEGSEDYFSLEAQCTATVTANTTYQQFSMNIAPSTVGVGSSVTISFENRSGQSVSLTFKKGSTTIQTMTATSDSVSVTPTDSWFTTAGETGTSMSVSVAALDALGRTASGSFTVKKALTVVTVSPKNTARIASSSMSYSFNVSGTTTLVSTELYINNQLRETVTGSATQIYSSYRPPAGTVSWFVKVTNNLGVVSQSDTATFTIQYISTSYLSPYNSKTSGSINRFAASTFTVQMQANGTPYTDYSVVDPVFYWRQSGESTWNSLTMTRQSVGGVYKRAAVTIPANTFPKGTIQWYASAGDGQGNTRSTSIYNLSTVAVPITATPTAPIDTVETSNTPTVFTWTNSGTITIYPTLAQLQYSTDNVSWNDMGTVEGTGTSYTEPAGILPGGKIFWRVRVKNTDDVWGDWSAPVSFENFGAPFVDNVTADSCPFSTVTWSSSTQAAYKIIVEGRVYGPYWGANVNSFQIPEPLSDGEHTVSVVVQNSYEQWSEPAETGFSVTNVPGEPVTLTGFFDRDAELSWSTNDATSDFLIYRDGVQIGHASGYSFTDRTVLDFHTWRVINRLPGGYYTASNTVSGTLCTEGLALALLAGGPWIDLTLSENPIRTTTAAAGRGVVLRQFAGREYPDAEAAPYKTLQISFDVSWTPAQADQARAFEALIGEAVIFKEPGEEAFVGVLSAFQRSHSFPARSYSATVQRIHWREYVDADS